MAADAKAASKRFKEPTSLLISSTTPATNTGKAAITNTGQSQVKVLLLGPSTSSPARLPAQIANPPTRGAGRTCLASALLISAPPATRPCHRSARTLTPTTTKATVAMDRQVQRSQV